MAEPADDMSGSSQVLIDLLEGKADINQQFDELGILDPDRKVSIINNNRVPTLPEKPGILSFIFPDVEFVPKVENLDFFFKT